jgi:hypothetical protein
MLTNMVSDGALGDSLSESSAASVARYLRRWNDDTTILDSGEFLVGRGTNIRLFLLIQLDISQIELGCDDDVFSWCFDHHLQGKSSGVPDPHPTPTCHDCSMERERVPAISC